MMLENKKPDLIGGQNQAQKNTQSNNKYNTTSDDSQRLCAKLKEVLPAIDTIIQDAKPSGTSCKCGGVDRFWYNPETGKCACRKCHPEQMDVIAFHMWYYNCTLEDLARQYLNNPVKRPQTPATDENLIAEYVYHDEHGKPVYFVAKYKKHGCNKTYRQGEKIDGRKSYQTKHLKKVLYNLLNVLKAYFVIFCEGEKDADNVGKLGFTATCNVGGAGNFRPEQLEVLRGKNVVILPDNDRPGREHARKLAKALKGISKAVKIVNLPNLPYKGDVSDWIDAGGTKDKLLKIIKETTAEQDLPVTSNDEVKRPVPLPLERVADKAENYPIDSFGDLLGGAVKSMNEVTQAPDAICAHSILGFAAQSVQGHNQIILDGRVIPLNIFLLSIALKSGRKSEADKNAGYIHKAFQERLMKKYKNDYEVYEDEIKIYEKASQNLIADKKLSLEQKNEDMAKLRTAKPKKPALPIYCFDDPTIEGIHKIFENGMPSKFLCADEGGQFSGGHSMKAENKQYAFTTMSHYWGGSSISRLRSGDGYSVLYNVALSIHLMMQPGVAMAFFHDKTMIDQGLRSRFCTVFPESLAGTRIYKSVDIQKDSRMIAYYNQVESNLNVNLPLKIDEQGYLLNELDRRLIPLTPEAKNKWVEAYNIIETQQKQYGDLAEIQGFAGKAGTHILKLAGVLATFEDLHIKEIPVEFIEKAIVLIQFYLNERLRISCIASSEVELSNAKKLLEWVRQKGLKVLTLPDVYQSGPGAFRNKKKAVEGINILQDHHWIYPLNNGGVSEISKAKSNTAWGVINETI